MNKLLAIILMLFLSSAVAIGQVINPITDNVKWSYRAGSNKRSSESLAISGDFITYGQKYFEWRQNGYDRTYRFEIKSSTGTWSNIGENGELVYDAVCEGVSGKISISRNRKNIVIHLDFKQTQRLTPDVVLDIINVSKI